MTPPEVKPFHGSVLEYRKFGRRIVSQRRIPLLILNKRSDFFTTHGGGDAEDGEDFGVRGPSAKAFDSGWQGASGSGGLNIDPSLRFIWRRGGINSLCPPLPSSTFDGLGNCAVRLHCSGNNFVLKLLCSVNAIWER